MAKSKKITIVGAGLSGMIAAINLAREDYEVTILEAESRVGGSPALHPSLHITPIDKEKVWRYIGVNLDECFITLKKFPIYVGESLQDIYPQYFFGVERGPRASSLDSRLYELAVEEGVTFKFGERVDRIDELPPKTIIATGLDHQMFETLELPYRDVPSLHVYKDADRDHYGLGIFSEYASEYFYGGAFNDLLYCMLPLDNPPNPANLARLIDDLKRFERIDAPQDEWRPVTFRVPLGGPANLKLFHRDKILAGTIAGMMDPFFLFGIHGAIISGKVAAMTVMDRERGLEEFNRVNRYFLRTYRAKQAFEMVPMKVRLSLLNSMANFPYLFAPAIQMISRGIPGHDDTEYFYRSFVGPDYQPPLPFRMAGALISKVFK